MQEEIFKPKYALKDNWDAFGLSLLIILGLPLYFRDGLRLSDISGLVLVAYLIFLLLNFSTLYIRRIVFSSSCFVVEKYLWPPKKIDYSDVTDLGLFKVKTRKGDFSLAGMSNPGHLRFLFSELVKEGKIQTRSTQGKVNEEVKFANQSIIPSLIIAGLLCGAVFYFWPFGRLSLNDLTLVFAILFFLASFVMRRILKKRAAGPRAGI